MTFSASYTVIGLWIDLVLCLNSPNISTSNVGFMRFTCRPPRSQQNLCKLSLVPGRGCFTCDDDDVSSGVEEGVLGFAVLEGGLSDKKRAFGVDEDEKAI
ncbi:hypothetical protein QQ045_020598 [Rhodiola kirilowii]